MFTNIDQGLLLFYLTAGVLAIAIMLLVFVWKK